MTTEKKGEKARERDEEPKEERKDWNPKEFSGEEMKKDADKDLITPKEERTPRDPTMFNREELKKDAEKEMVESEDMMNRKKKK